MGMFEESTNCCGIMELVGMNQDDWSPEKMLREAFEEYFFAGDTEGAMKGFCQVIFSVAYKPSLKKTDKRPAYGGVYPGCYKNRAKKFAKFIEDNKLGSCVLSKGHMNHGNHVLAGLWTVSRSGLLKWVRKEKIQLNTYRYDWQ